MKKMQIRFKCPECEDSLMAFAEGTHTCQECEQDLTEEQANSLFEAGELSAEVVSEDFDFKKKGKGKDDDDDEDEDDEDDEKDDAKKEESFYGFQNKDTWSAHLILQNEYAAFKDVSRVLEDTERLRKIASKHIAEAGVDEDLVNWEEIQASLQESKDELKAITDDVVSALSFDGENTVDESVKDNIVSVFEAALMVKYNNLKGALEEENETKLADALEEKSNALIEELGGFADEAVNEWFNENKIALEHGIRTEITESFMDGLTSLLKDHHVEIPEDRYDLVEDMAERIESLQAQLNESTSEKDGLQEEVATFSKTQVITKLSEGLADTQVEKLIELSGSIDYESEEQFETKLTTLKESFFSVSKNKKTGDVIITEQTENDDNKVVDRKDPIAMAAQGLRKRN
jgi:hypothetical protein